MDTRALALLAMLAMTSFAAECPTCGILSSRFTTDDAALGALMEDSIKAGFTNGSLAESILGLGACPGEPVTCSNGEYCFSMNIQIEMEVDVPGVMSYQVDTHQAFMGCMLDVMLAMSGNGSAAADDVNMLFVNEQEICSQMQQDKCGETEGGGEQMGGMVPKIVCDYKCGDWQDAGDIIDLPYNTYIVSIVFNDLPWLVGRRSRRSVDIPAAAGAVLEDELAALYNDTDGFLSVKIAQIRENGDGTYDVQFELYFSSLITPDQAQVETHVETFILANPLAQDDQTPTFTFRAAGEKDAAGSVVASALLVLAGSIAASLAI